MEIFTDWFLPLLGQSFHHLCTETTAFALECPTAGKLASHAKARCPPKDAPLQPRVFSIVFLSYTALPRRLFQNSSHTGF